MSTPQPPQPLRFGDILRRRRIAAGLTQEQLAERATLSARAISDLERGVNRAPQPGTLDLLAEALALSAEERAEFAAAVRRHAPLSAPPSVGAPAPAAPPDIVTPLDRMAPVAGVTDADARPPAPQRDETGLAVHALSLLAAPLALLTARGKMVGALLVIALLAGTLFSAGAAAQRARLPGRTLCIATDLPTSGQMAPLGKPVENAVNLAIQQNADLGNGYRLRAINYDDVSADRLWEDPRRGASNMAAMVKNPCVVGMVGPYGSHVAPGEMAIAANAGLVIISPFNTKTGLTVRAFADDLSLSFDQMHPPGKKTNYFRDIANDVIQGELGADLMFDELGSHSAYVVVDRTYYGADLTGGFTLEFLKRGGSIAGNANVPSIATSANPPDITQVAAKIAAIKPDAVYFGGVNAAGAGPLVKDLAADGYKGPFVSGDGVAGDMTFLKQAGEAAQNTYASLPGPDISTFTSGASARFLRDYHGRYPRQPVDGVSANAYDAAMALITVMRNLIRAGHQVTRPAMVDQIQNIHFQGVTGLISFDANGDDAHGQFTILQVQNGAWTVFKHVTL